MGSTNVQQLITDHIDLWTSAIESKKSSGRGGSKKQSLYGIKKLRELILELAVRGKLVPQDPNDEPASVLLERIAEERDRLVKEKKIKKPKKQTAITEGEKPFNLPQGWVWYRVGAYLDFQYGKSLPAKSRDDTGQYDVYGSNGVVGKHSLFLHEEPCIVIGRKGSAGALNKALSPSWTTDVAYFLVPPTGFSLEYTFLSLQTLRLDELGKGIKPGVNRNEAYQLVTALPPLIEQNRIVAKVDELMALCDQLEEQTENNIEAHQVLVETLLGTLTQSQNADELAENWERVAEHFDILFTTEHSIDQLKQTILQLAVMGKLVPQDPKDEPASVLLERIGVVKDQLVSNKMIKKQKDLPAISEDEVKFRIPSNWEWVKLGELASFINGDRGKNYPNKNEYVAKGVPWINTGHIEPNGSLTITDMNFITEEKYESLRSGKILDGDLVYCLRGATFGKTAFVEPYKKGAIASSLMIIRPHLAELRGYFYQYLVSPFGRSQIFRFDNGSAQPNLSANSVMLYAFPCPPIEEQVRIVKRIDELFSLCESLRSSLQLAQSSQLKITDSFIGKLS